MSNIHLINISSHPHNIADNVNKILNIINKLPDNTDALYCLPPYALRIYHPYTINDKLLNNALDQLAQELNNDVLISYPAFIENNLLKVHYYILGNNKRRFIGSIYLSLNNGISSQSRLNFSYKNEKYIIIPYSNDIVNNLNPYDNNIIIHDYEPFSYQHYLNVINNTSNLQTYNFVYQSVNSFDAGKLYTGLSARCQKSEIKYSHLFGEEGLVDDHKLFGLKDIDRDFDSIILKSLIVGLRRFIEYNKFKNIVIGLSGGLDSALVAALASESLGSEKVVGLIMPSMYSSQSSIDDAVLLAKNLGIEYHILPITSIYDKTLEVLNPVFAQTKFSIAEENIQARIRMLLLMAYSNKFGHIVLNTSNKSELSVGYGTLYGDLAGAFSLIGDLYKTQAYSISRYINNLKNKDLIPISILTKAPSAELHPGQKDEDSLPSYNLLDKVLYEWIECEKWNEPIDNLLKELNIDASEKNIAKLESVKHMIQNNEFKRHQFAPILRLSHKPLNEIILGKY
jgi:NAD+ synthetase